MQKSLKPAAATTAVFKASYWTTHWSVWQPDRRLRIFKSTWLLSPVVEGADYSTETTSFRIRKSFVMTETIQFVHKKHYSSRTNVHTEWQEVRCCSKFQCIFSHFGCSGQVEQTRALDLCKRHLIASSVHHRLLHETSTVLNASMFVFCQTRIGHAVFLFSRGSSIRHTARLILVIYSSITCRISFLFRLISLAVNRQSGTYISATCTEVWKRPPVISRQVRWSVIAIVFARQDMN